MNISIACPEALRLNPSVLDALKGAKVAIAGGLIGFEFQGDPLPVIREWDEGLGLAIADSNDAVEIRALSLLKATIAEVARHVHRESSYIDARRGEVSEPTTDDTGSHSHATSHASTDDSSEQHGAVSTNEEFENDETEEQEQGEAAGTRKRGRNRR